MLTKIVGKKIEIKPKIPKENEKLCEVCGGTGWMMNEAEGFILKCRNCYNGIITLCPDCGKPKRGVCVDDKCRTKREAREESARYGKAIKCKYEDVPEERRWMMYYDNYGRDEGYFSGFDELFDYCYENDIVVPKYVWSTTEIKMHIDAGSVIEDACDQLWEEASYQIDDADRKELQNYLDVWCRRQTGTTSYMVDYKYAIEVPDE